LSLISLAKRHVGLAGFTGVFLALAYTVFYRFAPVDYVVGTLAGFLVNIVVVLALSRVYSRLAGSPGSWGAVIEAGLAQLLAFLAFSAALYNLLLTL